MGLPELVVLLFILFMFAVVPILIVYGIVTKVNERKERRYSDTQPPTQ